MRPEENLRQGVGLHHDGDTVAFKHALHEVGLRQVGVFFKQLHILRMVVLSFNSECGGGVSFNAQPVEFLLVSACVVEMLGVGLREIMIA